MLAREIDSRYNARAAQSCDANSKDFPTMTKTKATLTGTRCMINQLGAQKMREMDSFWKGWGPDQFSLMPQILYYGDLGTIESRRPDPMGGVSIRFDNDPGATYGFDIAWIDILPGKGN